MFWGLVLKTNKRYSQQVTKAFHVSQATLDLGTLNPNEKDAVVQVWLHTDDTDHLLANVNRQTSHVRLDLAFTEGETVAFYSKGNGTVHLSGYLIPDDDDFGEFPTGAGDEEEEDSDEEVEVPVKKQKVSKKQAKEEEQQEEEEEEENDDDDDDEDSSDLDLDALAEELEDEEAEDEEEDSDEEENDEEDDDEENEESDVEAPPAKHAKLEKNAKQNGLTNGKLSKKENEQKQKNKNQDKHEQKQKNQQQNQGQKSTPKTLSGGVVIEDLRVGKGPEAKAGKKVSVYYEGRLKSNNKVFDSTKSGQGFNFPLGRGEVIRGWDIGVVGMKVGGKRRITCPPNVAYGSKGAPPTIPGNATLVFEVELRNVN